MVGPTDEEQLFLELINDARLDPLGNAARYIDSYSPLLSSDSDIQNALNFFGVVGTTLESAYEALIAVQPLAWNEDLADAARDHNAVMIVEDEQTHQATGEDPFSTRVETAGYTGWNALGENVFAFTESVLYGHAGFMVDWGGPNDGMQVPPGHRNNIMSANFREVGIGVTEELSGSTSVGPLIVTQDFGNRFGLSSTVIILGVAYSDADQNDFYSIGEGLTDLEVSIGADEADSTDSGGYTLHTNSSGAQTISFGGAGIAGTLSAQVTLAAGSNYKFDIVNGDTLKTSTSAIVSGAGSAIIGLGITGLTLTGGSANDWFIVGTPGNDALTGNSNGDELQGGLGNDTLNGGTNVDRAIFSGDRSDYVITPGASGATIVGPDGTDALSGVERLVFDDMTVNLPFGLGTSVDVANADPDIFMAAIRDFDGVNLGSSTSWLRIGSTDIQGDGDIEFIFVNRDIGRWATIGPAYDSLVYFNDYGWGGDTRVVGTYIDPLVASEDVVQGSPFDSQQRFQNDLFIENINAVLHADDYDGDGLQEIYFGLTDETAYLHAYMHADGNIQYANYQSEQQVIDYLTANGFASETWEPWLYSNAPASLALSSPSSNGKNLFADRFAALESMYVTT